MVVSIGVLVTGSSSLSEVLAGFASSGKSFCVMDSAMWHPRFLSWVMIVGVKMPSDHHLDSKSKILISFLLLCALRMKRLRSDFFCVSIRSGSKKSLRYLKSWLGMAFLGEFWCTLSLREFDEITEYGLLGFLTGNFLDCISPNILEIYILANSLYAIFKFHPKNKMERIMEILLRKSEAFLYVKKLLLMLSIIYSSMRIFMWREKLWSNASIFDLLEKNKKLFFPRSGYSNCAFCMSAILSSSVKFLL